MEVDEGPVVGSDTLLSWSVGDETFRKAYSLGYVLVYLENAIKHEFEGPVVIYLVNLRIQCQTDSKSKHHMRARMLHNRGVVA